MAPQMPRPRRACAGGGRMPTPLASRKQTAPRWCGAVRGMLNNRPDQGPRDAAPEIG
jgi:hypothetical protein